MEKIFYKVGSEESIWEKNKYVKSHEARENENEKRCKSIYMQYKL